MIPVFEKWLTNWVFCAKSAFLRNKTKKFLTDVLCKRAVYNRIAEKLMRGITTKTPIFAFRKTKRDLWQKTN